MVCGFSLINMLRGHYDISPCERLVLLVPCVLVFVISSTYNPKDDFKQITMLPSLKWATLALSIPLSMADRLAPRVKWEDLMLATSEFPRFFGEVTNLNRTGPPRVVAAQKAEGERWIIMPVKCAGATSEEFHCDYDCPHCGPVAQEFSYPIFQFQNASRPDLNLNNLTFVASNFSETNKSGILSRNFFFTQTNLGGTVEIDNAIVQLNWVSR